jgi:pimeloyl-ACP methyl ester carboxylesterase
MPEVIEGAGHWVHQEQPDRVNELILDHLVAGGTEAPGSRS